MKKINRRAAGWVLSGAVFGLWGGCTGVANATTITFSGTVVENPPTWSWALPNPDVRIDLSSTSSDTFANDSLWDVVQTPHILLEGKMSPTVSGVAIANDVIPKVTYKSSDGREVSEEGFNDFTFTAIGYKGGNTTVNGTLTLTLKTLLLAATETDTETDMPTIAMVSGYTVESPTTNAPTALKQGLRLLQEQLATASFKNQNHAINENTLSLESNRPTTVLQNSNNDTHRTIAAYATEVSKGVLRFPTNFVPALEAWTSTIIIEVSYL